MPIVIKKDHGTPLPGEFEVTIKIRSGDTDGAMAVLEETVPPRKLITPHTHQNDVGVYVLSGEIGVLVGDKIEIAGPGDWVLKPRNVMHAMWNTGVVPARIIEVLTPAGTERWFEEISALSPGDNTGFEESCQRHGIQFLKDSPWAAELRRRYNLL